MNDVGHNGDSFPRDEQFRLELGALVDELRPRFSVREMCAMLHIRPSLLYKWLRGHATPIWIARKAVLSVLAGLRTAD